MKEKAVVFGAGRSLTGVSCEPLTLGAEVPAVIILNSGVIHHVGIGRLHVRLARVLVQEGVPTLRFDLSGIGDSRAATASVSLETLVQLDLDAAIEQVRSAWGIEDVVLVGLCSGAADSFKAALRLPNIVGIVPIDLITDLRTWQHFAVHYGRRLARWESWRNTLNGRKRTLDRILSTVRGHSRVEDDNGDVFDTLGLRAPTSRAQLRSGLSRILDRGGRALCIFSGGLEYNYNHRSQFHEALQGLAGEPNLSLAYFGQADHTFSVHRHQSALVRCIQGWMVEQFGVGTGKQRKRGEEPAPLSGRLSPRAE